METARNFIDTLVGLEKIKVWSLIASLFGDLDKSGLQSLSGKQLNSLLGHIGIKPEATRVALHRLKNENWIDTSRVGRETHYRMSKNAALETVAVYDEVYSTLIKYPDGWHLQLSLENDNQPLAPHIPVFRNVSLVPITSENSKPENLVVEFNRSHIPDWFEEKIVNSKVQLIARELTKVVSNIDNTMSQYSKLDQTALRLLTLHHWRKMALRDTIWCHIWLFENGSLSKCQNTVPHFLNSLPKIDGSMLG